MTARRGEPGERSSWYVIEWCRVIDAWVDCGVTLDAARKIEGEKV